jgi:hypothetical protein
MLHEKLKTTKTPRHEVFKPPPLMMSVTSGDGFHQSRRRLRGAAFRGGVVVADDAQHQIFALRG